MGRNRRCFVNNTCLEVSFRAEEGLPLIAAAYMRVILKGIIARAYELYDITVCHMLVMSNHVHGILVVEDPECVKGFVGYIKRESAHAINRLLGRRKRTIWCEGYAATVILDAEKAIERIVYLYTNPQEAGLVEKIEDYPNLSTWGYFVSGGGELRARRIPRHAISSLPAKDLSLSEQAQYASDLEQQGEEESAMFVDPDAWMNCFPELGESDCESVNRIIVERIRAKEEAFSKNRVKPVLGAHALRIERINKPHVPKKYGRQMICMASKKEKRIPFVQWYKEHIRDAKEIFRRWMHGDWQTKLSPGLFSPGGLLVANILPAVVPLK